MMFTSFHPGRLICRDARVIGTLSDAQLEQLVDALERKEGYHKDADTRQEKWVTQQAFPKNTKVTKNAGAS